MNHTSRRFRPLFLGVRMTNRNEGSVAKREVQKNAMDADSVMATGDLGGRGKKKTRQMEDLAP